MGGSDKLHFQSGRMTEAGAGGENSPKLLPRFAPLNRDGGGSAGVRVGEFTGRPAPCSSERRDAARTRRRDGRAPWLMERAVLSPTDFPFRPKPFHRKQWRKKFRVRANSNPGFSRCRWSRQSVGHPDAVETHGGEGIGLEELSHASVADHVGRDDGPGSTGDGR